MSTPSVVNCLSEVRPPITRHDPSKWADTFSNISIDQQVQRKYREEIEALKQQVGGMLKAAATPTEQMILIDTLERLGVAYHFETEIEQKLQQIYIADEDVRGDYDLFTTSLQFRLFRQHQHPISCDVFAKFMDKDGKFEESLSSDVEGILSLYEAAHVGFRDETLLQDAARFSRHHLRGMEAALESPLREKVQRALEHPFHRDVPIFYAYFFISNIYQKDDSRNDLLLKLAKLSLMFLQNLYKEELCELTRWWNEFDLKSKLTYARDRLVESYMWGVAYHYEPQYSYVRTGYAKSLQIVTMMDDTYDNYATLDEAELFTQILDSAFQDYERNATKFGKEFAAPYFKEMIQQLGRAYNKELKWVMGREMPSFVEYAQNSEVTSTIYIQFAAIIPGLESVTQETIDWMKSEPRIAISTGMLGRYADDIGSYERENKEGKMLTAVECYMKQYGASKQEALRKFGERIEELWKDINKEFVATTYIPRETTVHFLNYGRMCDASYGDKNKDGYTDPKVYQSLVAALFINPMIL